MVQRGRVTEWRGVVLQTVELGRSVFAELALTRHASLLPNLIHILLWKSLTRIRSSIDNALVDVDILT